MKPEERCGNLTEQEKETCSAQLLVAMMDDAVENKNTRQLAFAIRALLRHSGWPESMIHSVGPTYSLTSTPLLSDICEACCTSDE